jgi:anti-anti-sigma factor
MEKDATTNVTINGAMNIYNAGGLRSSLTSELKGSKGLSLDLKGVVEMDTAGVQILILLKKEAINSGKDLKVLHSSATGAALDAYRLKEFFELAKDS